jgi:hypothetical protein
MLFSLDAKTLCVRKEGLKFYKVTTKLGHQGIILWWLKTNIIVWLNSTERVCLNVHHIAAAQKLKYPFAKDFFCKPPT